MKLKLYLAAVAALALGFLTNAQLQVLPSGATQVGSPTYSDTTAGDFVVAEGTTYEIEHKGSVTLMPGFKVEQGATFSVKPSDY